MKKTETVSFSRYILYFGLTIQIMYIIITPFMEVNSIILISTACLMIAAFMDLSIAKDELEKMKAGHEIAWDTKRKRLQNYYKDEKNLDKSFSECLNNIQMEDTHNERISKILESYQKNNQKFKIKLNRKPENRMEKYLYED